MAQAGQQASPQVRTIFQSANSTVVDIHLDYRAASYTGRETIRFTNSTRDELDSLQFALYPNYGLGDNDPLLLKVQSVKLGSRELRFSLRARGALLRVELPSKLPPQQSLELSLSFAAKLPRVPKEEAGLYAHFLQELSDASGDDRQVGDARDIFFAGDGAMVLGYCFPLLVANQMQFGDPGLVAGTSGAVFSEVADYEVSIKADENLQVIASGVSGESTSTKLLNLLKISTRWSTFRAEKLRGFALLVCENFKSAEKRVGDTRVVSHYPRGR
jgi:hypothetical protein